MKERELLERAAKAAGVVLIDRAMGTKGYIIDGGKYWSPLADDGDIARLEAACEIDVSWRADHVHACAITKDGAAIDAHEYFERHGGDKHKARRYASTRAAASLAPTGEVV